MPETPKHTPGPWKIGCLCVHAGGREIYTADENELWIGSIHKNHERKGQPANSNKDFPTNAQGEANVCLIAAAPELLEAVKQAHHELTCLHGLIASDGLDAYAEAQRDGCDPNGAWDCFCEETFKINTQIIIQKIDAAIANAEKGIDHA